VHSRRWASLHLHLAAPCCHACHHLRHYAHHLLNAPQPALGGPASWAAACLTVHTRAALPHHLHHTPTCPHSTSLLRGLLRALPGSTPLDWHAVATQPCLRRTYLFPCQLLFCLWLDISKHTTHRPAIRERTGVVSCLRRLLRMAVSRIFIRRRLHYYAQTPDAFARVPHAHPRLKLNNWATVRADAGTWHATRTGRQNTHIRYHSICATTCHPAGRHSSLHFADLSPFHSLTLILSRGFRAQRRAARARDAAGISKRLTYHHPHHAATDTLYSHCPTSPLAPAVPTLSPWRCAIQLIAFTYRGPLPVGHFRLHAPATHRPPAPTVSETWVSTD